MAAAQQARTASAEHGPMYYAMSAALLLALASFYAYFFWQVCWLPDTARVASVAYRSLYVVASSLSTTAECSSLSISATYAMSSMPAPIPPVYRLFFLQRAARGGGGDLRARRGRRGGPWQWLWPKRKAY